MRKDDDGMRVELELVGEGPGSLRLRYRTGNPWGRELYLVNRLFATDPTGAIAFDPNRVYVTVEDGTLHLAKQFVEVPEGMDVECPEVPFLTMLQPGEAFAEEFELPLPTRVVWPYEPFRSGVTRDEATTCEQIDFALGYFLPRERAWVTEVEVGGQRLLASEYGYLRQAHRLVVSRKLKHRCACVVTVRET
jgi:hypothetical protein